MTSPPDRTNIPLPIQREVRQRCGFGCVVCGLPLYEYEHMEEWAVVRRHVAEEITLLCDRHHREKTGGLLPKEVVKAANKDPFNLRTGASKPYDLHFAGDEANVNIGGNWFSCKDVGDGTQMMPLLIDGVALIGIILQDGHYLLNVVAFNEFNEPILHIKNNQLFYSTSPWDVQLIGTTLTIREAHRRLLLEVNFAPPSTVEILRGRFLRNGVEVIIRPDKIQITNNNTTISNCRAINCLGGLILGHMDKEPGGFFRMQSIPRYLGDRSLSKQFYEAEERPSPPATQT